MIGVLRAGELSLHEAHRFLHAPAPMPGALTWDLPMLWREIREGLKRAAAWAASNDVEIASIGVDTWGVDFALLSKQGALLAMPRCYRNPEHADGLAILEQQLGRSGIYERTGIRSMALNTSSQLAGWVARDPAMFQAAGRLLFMPDLFHFLLSGVACTEQSIASTSQLLDARTRDWSGDVLSAIGLPRDILPTIVQPGTVLGPLLPEIASQTGLPASTKVITPAAHDTASAVVGTPLSGPQSCYLSSGTWSLLGLELDHAIVSEDARAADFTNEHGVAGTTRFLKNVIGLWLVQELKRDLARGGVVQVEDGKLALTGDFLDAAGPVAARITVKDEDDKVVNKAAVTLRPLSGPIAGVGALADPGAVDAAELEQLLLGAERGRDREVGGRVAQGPPAPGAASAGPTVRPERRRSRVP